MHIICLCCKESPRDRLFASQALSHRSALTQPSAASSLLTMARQDLELASPIEARDAADIVDQLPHYSHSQDALDEKLAHKESSAATQSVEVDELDDAIYDKSGGEKVLETAADFSRALVSSEDDPKLPIHTFRMWFTGIGLAVFGAVLGMLFVSTEHLQSSAER